MLHVCTPQETVSSLRAGWTLLAGSLPAQSVCVCVCACAHVHARVHACVFTAWQVGEAQYTWAKGASAGGPAPGSRPGLLLFSAPSRPGWFPGRLGWGPDLQLCSLPQAEGRGRLPLPDARLGPAAGAARPRRGALPGQRRGLLRACRWVSPGPPCRPHGLWPDQRQEGPDQGSHLWAGVGGPGLRAGGPASRGAPVASA